MNTRSLRQRLRQFRASYERLSENGHCDAPGGMEYRRVRNEWLLAGFSESVDQFIRWRANAWPGEEETVN